VAPNLKGPPRLGSPSGIEKNSFNRELADFTLGVAPNTYPKHIPHSFKLDTDIARQRSKFSQGAKLEAFVVPPDHLLLDRSPNIGPLISRWELDKFKNC
jgi:hypothetical protein